jgi:hypothetical protein
MDWIPKREEKIAVLMGLWQSKLADRALQTACDWTPVRSATQTTAAIGAFLGALIAADYKSKMSTSFDLKAGDFLDQNVDIFLILTADYVYPTDRHIDLIRTGNHFVHSVADFLGYLFKIPSFDNDLLATFQHFIGTVFDHTGELIELPHDFQDLPASHALFFHSGPDILNLLRHELDPVINGGELVHNVFRGLDDLINGFFDLFQNHPNGFGLLAGRFRQFADFIGHYRKALPGFSGVGGLNGGVHG